MLGFRFCKQDQSLCLIICPLLFPFFNNHIQSYFEIFEMSFFYCRSMAVKQFYILNSGKTICILCDFHSITVASIHNNLTNISAENSRKECKCILLLFFHCLRFVSKNRHSAWKQFFQKYKLYPGIILHLIYDDVLDSMMISAFEK